MILSSPFLKTEYDFPASPMVDFYARAKAIYDFMWKSSDDKWDKVFKESLSDYANLISCVNSIIKALGISAHEVRVYCNTGEMLYSRLTEEDLVPVVPVIEIPQDEGAVEVLSYDPVHATLVLLMSYGLLLPLGCDDLSPTDWQTQAKGFLLFARHFPQPDAAGICPTPSETAFYDVSDLQHNLYEISQIHYADLSAKLTAALDDYAQAASNLHEENKKLQASLDKALKSGSTSLFTWS